MNVTALLATPPTVTTTDPVVAPAGTGAVIEVLLHTEGIAVVPLKVMVLLPLVVPKLLPAIVTTVPTGPRIGDKLLILGAELTVNVTALLAAPATVTTTGPVVAAAGTGTVMELLLHAEGIAVVPLNLTVLLP